MTGWELVVGVSFCKAVDEAVDWLKKKNSLKSVANCDRAALEPGSVAVERTRQSECAAWNCDVTLWGAFTVLGATEHDWPLVANIPFWAGYYTSRHHAWKQLWKSVELLKLSHCSLLHGRINQLGAPIDSPPRTPACRVLCMYTVLSKFPSVPVAHSYTGQPRGRPTDQTSIPLLEPKVSVALW